MSALYGLIGEKLVHSFSKLIHEQLADYNYHLIPLSKEEFPLFMERKDFAAINVTIPYKQSVIPYCDELDAQAKSIGAVNTIVNQNGRLIGHNTDFAGVEYMLQSKGISFAGKKVMILGSGGTCKTITAVAKQQGAAAVTIVSRSGQMGLTYQQALFQTDTQVIVNASPVGMYPRNLEKPIDLAAFPNCCAVVDVIYNPLQTMLLLQAKERSIPCVGGLTMLVAQAKYAAEYFLGTSLPDNIPSITCALCRKQSNLVLIGMPSAGKSMVGKMLAQKLGKTFVDLDAQIVQRVGCDIPALFAQWGEVRFRQLESEAVREAASRNDLVIATGGGVVKDPQNIRALKQNGVLFFLDRDCDKLIAGSSRPLSSSGQAIQQLYEERYELYHGYCDVRVENNERMEDAVETAAAAFEQLMASL